MKIRSLLLGSAAVAGLTTGAYAADLGVMTSLDVCDSLGLSGLTISSDTNCLQITGEVKYKFTWGDYVNYADPSVADFETPKGTLNYAYGDDYTDWTSRFDAWIKFVATADSDFGPAKAVIKLKEIDTKDQTGYSTWTLSSASSSGLVDLDGNPGGASSATFSTWDPGVSAGAVTGATSDTGGVVMDEAYVSIGDSTVIMAGKKGSIYNTGDDAPLGWLGLFNSEKVDVGVGTFDHRYADDTKYQDPDTGGHVIQVTSDLGNGFSISAGLENLNGSTYATAGTAVGVLAYSGDGISAHAGFKANGILAGEVQDWAAHAGFTGTFDNFKVVLAGAFDSTDYWNVLAGASATFDMFTIAGDFEAANADCDILKDYTTGDTNYGACDSSGGNYWAADGSISAKVTDTVTLNVGGRWAHMGDGDEGFEVAAGVVAAVTDTLTLTGKVGYVDDGWQTLYYGKGQIDWAPGGGLTTSVAGTVTSDNGYKIESTFKKAFE